MDTQNAICFDPARLGQLLEQTCTEVVFALLHGSARDGMVKPGSDVDIAIYVRGKVARGVLLAVMDAVAQMLPTVECDVGVLNLAEPVYRFEALRGRLLFTRDQEAYLRFYSLTCREYEDQLADYGRQHRYRLEAHRAGGIVCSPMA